MGDAGSDRVCRSGFVVCLRPIFGGDGVRAKKEADRGRIFFWSVCDEEDRLGDRIDGMGDTVRDAGSDRVCRVVCLRPIFCGDGVRKAAATMAELSLGSVCLAGETRCRGVKMRGLGLGTVTRLLR